VQVFYAICPIFLLSYRDDIGEERLPCAGTALLGNKEYGHTTRIQKHGIVLHAVFWFISTMLLRHTGLVNKVQKYITQPWA